MSNEFLNAGCLPSDCASCTENCSGSAAEKEIPRTITLTLEDDSEVECAILTIFPIASREYIALLPLDDNGQPLDGDVYLYAFSRTENGDPMLANIEDEDEYAQAATAFNEIADRAREAEKAGLPIE